MSEQKTMRLVEEIPTLDLITELCKRCAPAVFIGMKTEEDGTNSFYEVKGNSAVCYGMCHELASKIQMNAIEKLTSNAGE